MSLDYIFKPVLLLCTFKSALNRFCPCSRVIAARPIFLRPSHALALSRTRMLAGVGNRATTGTCCPRRFCGHVDVVKRV